ncbi:hypothetical protein QS257_02515 [Terrilactibacillus sp. S3-3]|nr:hypothetical protein QS257_02515 [Terrilactibacillus sp. S3-3]
MGVREGSLRMLNLVSQTVIAVKKNWAKEAEGLRQMALAVGVYPNGPLIMTIADVKNEPDFRQYTFFLPLSSVIDPVDDSSIRFYDELFIERALVVRHYDEEEPFSNAYGFCGKRPKNIV